MADTDAPKWGELTGRHDDLWFRETTASEGKEASTNYPDRLFGRGHLDALKEGPFTVYWPSAQ